MNVHWYSVYFWLSRTSTKIKKEWRTYFPTTKKNNKNNSNNFILCTKIQKLDKNKNFKLLRKPSRLQLNINKT